MASKKNIEPAYTTELHMRLKPDERAQLQKRADELGITLSQAARRIIFKRIEDGPSDLSGFGEKEIQFRMLQNLQSAKTLFRKISTDISKFLAGYERSLSATNQAGDPAVSTEQTIRIMTSIVINQIKLQDGLNQVIRHFGGAEVHVAAKPQKGTAVGDALAGAADTNDSVEQKKVQLPEGAKEKNHAIRDKNEKSIPIEFKTMFIATFNGTLIADVETFTDGQYEKIHIVATGEIYRKGQTKKITVDAVDFAARYKKVIPYLTSEKNVIINGDLDLDVYAYNGKTSAAQATIEIKNLTLL